MGAAEGRSQRGSVTDAAEQDVVAASKGAKAFIPAPDGGNANGQGGNGKVSSSGQTGAVVEAKAMLRKYHGRIFNMAGPANVSARQRLIEVLTGKKPPKAKAGIDAVRKEVNKAAGITTTSESRSDDLIAKWVREDPETDSGTILEQRTGTPIGNRKTVTVDGKERPALNSKGKPVHTTVEGVENFWRWFGDSKAVDKDGRPLLLERSNVLVADGNGPTGISPFRQRDGHTAPGEGRLSLKDVVEGKVGSEDGETIMPDDYFTRHGMRYYPNGEAADKESYRTVLAAMQSKAKTIYNLKIQTYYKIRSKRTNSESKIPPRTATLAAPLICQRTAFEGR